MAQKLGSKSKNVYRKDRGNSVFSPNNNVSFVDKRGLVLFLFLAISIVLLGFTSAFDWGDGTLVSYYKLDEVTGTNVWDIHGVNNATADNAGVFTSSIVGRINTGADFTNDYVATVATTPFAGLTAFSVSFWANIDWASSAQWGVMVSSSEDDTNDWLIRKSSNDAGLTGLISTDGSAGSLTSPTGKGNGLYHIVMTWNGTGASLYVNNTVDATDADVTGTMTSTSKVFTIGSGEGTNSGRYMENMMDEIGIWNKSLTPAEVSELYNSGLGLAYVAAAPPASVYLDQISPTNEFLQNSSQVFSGQYNITNYGSTNVSNVTMRIWNSTGYLVSTNTTVLHSPNNASGNLTYTNSVYGNLTYNFEIVYNDTETWSTNVTSNRTFLNGINVRIIDPDGVFISDGVCYLDITYYGSNNIDFPSASLNSFTAGTLSVNASSTSGNYVENNTILTIDMSKDLVYNVTLTPYKLNLKFFLFNGTAVNVTAYVSDLGNITTFTNISYLRQQDTFNNNKINVRFIKGIYNYTDINWENKSQFFEYSNAPPYTINENITVIQTVDTSTTFQIRDYSENIIDGATVKLFGAIPSNATSGISEFKFLGQRITDSTGLITFPLDSEMEIYVQVSASGYTTDTVSLTASELGVWTTTTPYPVRLKKGAYTNVLGVFVTALYKQDGSKVYESKWDDLSKDYYIFVYDFALRTITYNTTLRSATTPIVLDTTTRSGVLNLESGKHFSDTSNSTWYVYIYVDDILAYTIPIIFDSDTQTTMFDIDAKGLRSSDAWRAIVFGMIILAASIVGLIFGGSNEDAGLHTFFIACLIGSLAVDGLGFLMSTAAFFYLGGMIKRYYSE
jgi:hypothetical protein